MITVEFLRILFESFCSKLATSYVTRNFDCVRQEAWGDWKGYGSKEYALYCFAKISYGANYWGRTEMHGAGTSASRADASVELANSSTGTASSLGVWPCLHFFFLDASARTRSCIFSTRKQTLQKMHVALVKSCAVH